MPLMHVRFVITGACYVSYSGRQIQLEIPVTQPDGSRTTVADVEAQVRAEWPSDMAEMAESIKTIEMKILKTGRLLKNDDIFEEQLTKAELTECEVVDDKGRTPEEIEKSSVLMHLVFQKPRPPVEPASPDSGAGKKERESASDAPSPASRGANASGGGNHAHNGGSTGDREVKSDNCCTVM